MALEKLVIKDFQCHEKFILKFDPEITVLVGKSDSGKSAILRALRWLMTNQPSGDEFIHHRSSSAKVTLYVDSHVTTREKGKGSNSYTLDGAGYYALGQGGIPDAVSKVLNISPVNFQMQLDNVFWFSLTPGECAKEINSIVNLSLIDDVLDRISSESRKAKTVVDISRERLEENEKRLSHLSWIEECEQEYRSIELKECTSSEIEQECVRTAALIEDVRIQGEALRASVGACNDGRPLLDMISEALSVSEEIKSTEQLIKEYQNEWERHEQNRDRLTAIKRELEEAGPLVCPTCNRTLTNPLQK